MCTHAPTLTLPPRAGEGMGGGCGRGNREMESSRTNEKDPGLYAQGRCLTTSAQEGS
jgi:hypothetical protein